MNNLQYYTDRALELRAQGYNCSQCIALAFGDHFADRYDLTTIEALTAALGGGVAGQRGTCGVVSAMAAIASLSGYGSPADKKSVYAAGAGLGRTFADEFGALSCNELKFERHIPCADLIRRGVALVYSCLSGKEEQ